jgi:iron-sulfur cluster repair protein YtfE (RIC family)
MGRGVPGHSAPSAGFEVPLEMLSACHHRIEQQCATLRRLVEHLGAHGADADARIAAQGVLRYFDTSALHHHADEEEDLFPALLESMAGSDAVCLRELTQALTAEHRELEARWRRLRVALEQVARGEDAQLSQADVDAFVDRYAAHLEREERELLPMAGRLLADEDLARVGRAMRERRGIGPVD